MIGLGLGTKDISALALEEIKEADELLIETYTAFVPQEHIDFIEKYAGRKPTPLSRSDLEDNVKQTVARGKEEKVVLLVPGDPLIATTHSIILNEAKKQGIKCEVIHAPSVFSIAIGESGLDVYKFGPTVTIPFWSERYKPASFLDAINKNIENGQHTLVLLDIDQKNSRPMKVAEAERIIEDALAAGTRARINVDSEVVILANLGRADKIIRRKQIKNMGELSKALEGKVLSLIVPASLSFAEEESLKRAVDSTA